MAAGEKKPANLHVDFEGRADEDDDAGDVDTSMFDMQSMMAGAWAMRAGARRVMSDFALMMKRAGGGAPGGGAPEGRTWRSPGTDSDHENGGREETGSTLEPGRGSGSTLELLQLEIIVVARRRVSRSSSRVVYCLRCVVSFRMRALFWVNDNKTSTQQSPK